MKKNTLFLIGGMLFGLVLLVGARFITLKSDTVHYHANFALYINGQQDRFDGPGYYEEIQTCGVHDEDDIRGRVHMHDQNNHVVHVHAHAVSWDAFFANLGYTLGDKVISTSKGTYVDGQDGNKLTLKLNGKDVKSIAGKLIKSEDVLLINYGNDGASTLQKRYDDIPRDAHQANVSKDPAACSGGQALGFWTRLQRAIGINDSQ